MPELPLKLVIIDERYVMFGMEDPVLGRLGPDDGRRRAPVARGHAEDRVRHRVGSAGSRFDEAHERLVPVAKTA